jgi:putative transposase
MSQTLSPSLARRYGMARARVEDLARQRLSLSQGDAAEHDRPLPWSDRRVLGRGTGRAYPPAHSRLPPSRLYRKLWARLRFAGVRTSPRRVRRVMRENGLLARRWTQRDQATRWDDHHRQV